MKLQTPLLSKKKARIIIIILGFLQLAIGLISLGFAPLEVHSYYLFSEGGRFHYDSFGIGSILYGLIFAQIAGFYFLALLFIPLGYGHVTFKKWVPGLSKSYIWFWVIFGMPVALFFLPLLSMKEIGMRYSVLAGTLFIILFIVIIPAFLLCFYNQKTVKELFIKERYIAARFGLMPVSAKLLSID